MYSITRLQEKINKEINDLQLHNDPQELYEPIKYTIDSGGKRIRPALVLAACNLFSETIEDAVPAALAFEIFHNFTLLHDDIMDNSPIRRNKTTVHVKWNKNTAILSGDAMMIKAYGFLKYIPENLLKPVFSIFNDTALEVCEGQQFDMNYETRNDVSEEEYLNMIKLKTSVLIAACLKSGAVIGGASEENANLLYDFGLNIGLAFQLQDDLLDVYADTEIFGKQTGNDIITGKKTFLLINAFKNADKETSELLSNLLKADLQNAEKIKKVKRIYNELNIKKLTEIRIQYYHQKALESLQSVNVKTDRKEILLNFAEEIMNRKK